MKLKLVIAVGFFALFGLMNQPFIPVPVRMTTYALALIPSAVASGLTFWYYDSTMEAKHTVLTTAAKSAVGWHATASTTYYGQLTIASIWSTDLEEYWNNNGNQTCGTIIGFSVGPTFIVSLFEFQVIRALFVFFPYEVLALNHDSLAYPLVASVPTLSGIMLMINYWNSGGICDPIFLNNIFEKMDIVVNAENFLFSSVDLASLFNMAILVLEVCILLKNNWKVIKVTVMYTVCWWKRRNAVFPSDGQPSSSTDQSSSEIPQITTHLKQYKVGPFVLLTFCFLFLQVLLLLQNCKMIAANQVIQDIALLGLPIYWVISSDGICDFIKLKYSQLMYRLGYF